MKENESAPDIVPDDKRLPKSLEDIVKYGKSLKRTAQNEIFTEEKKGSENKDPTEEVKEVDAEILELTKKRFATKSNNVYYQLDFEITKLILKKHSLLDK